MGSNENYGREQAVWSKWAASRENFSDSHTQIKQIDNRGQRSDLAIRQTNYNEYFIQKAEESLARLTELDDNDPYHIGDAVYKRALNLLSFLRHSVEMPAPMVLPEGEEDVSLTWDGELSKRYLSISLDSIEIMDLNKEDLESVIIPLGEDDDVDFQKLIALMTGNLRTSSHK